MGIGQDSSCVSQVQCSNAETALSFSMVVLEQAGWEMELKLANGRGLISGPHSTLEMTADLKRFWAQELGALDAMTTLKRKASVSQAHTPVIPALRSIASLMLGGLSQRKQDILNNIYGKHTLLTILKS